MRSAEKVTSRELKPLARARSGAAFFERSGHVSISRFLEEELFQSAKVLSEGSCRTGSSGNDAYFGSTMITFDLARVGRYWRGAFDKNARERLAHAVEGSVRIHLRAMRLAYAEVARRVSDKPIGTVLVETKVRLSGDFLYLDIDLEAPIGISFISRTS
jgi:hypothetical protein